MVSGAGAFQDILKRFNWRAHPELEDRSRRTHTTKDFQDPNDPTKRIVIESSGLLHAFIDKGFQDIKTELPNYAVPGA